MTRISPTGVTITSVIRGASEASGSSSKATASGPHIAKKYAQLVANAMGLTRTPPSLIGKTEGEGGPAAPLPVLRVHRVPEVLVSLRVLHLVEQELHRVDRAHR